MASSAPSNTSPPAPPPTSTWLRRLIISLTLLAWIALAFVLVWLIGRVAQALLLLAIGALLAYVLYPLVRFFHTLLPVFFPAFLANFFIFTAWGSCCFLSATTSLNSLNSLFNYL